MANDTVPLGYPATETDLDEAAQYDWGSAILASLYHGLDTAVTTGGTSLDFPNFLRMPLQVPNGNCKYYLGDRCWRRLTGETRIPLDPPLSMSPHISQTALQEMKQAGILDCEQFVIREEQGTYASYWAEQTLKDFSLPGKPEGPDPGWHMEWIGRCKFIPIHRLRDPPPMSSSYDAEELWHLAHGIRRLPLAESAQDAQNLQQLTDELSTAHRHIDIIDD
ncbi:hypothetical protein GIB67_011606 [Kingdonia uniflora]|uniref:Uncharacterized protein n=1 Tax=Kingdonia uniflora TaxID=39325 RepID=A0A7J7NLW7_9MAGN|nr:hypothetical protein GIB67_011606 [Kingdonia uniflora]